jgi:membrane-associated phospholipid phosphatase
MYLLASVWEKLEAFDKWLFMVVNTRGANPFFDAVMPFMRQSMHWMPLYLFLIVFVILNFKAKGLWWVLFFISTIALTDMTGTYIFKQSFERMRPCADPAFFTHVRLLLNHCSGSSSFVSNHAANHFGMAVFFLFTFRRLFSKWAFIPLAWAAIIAYAQVYVGVHYPLDVFAGAFIGVLWGWVTSSLFNKRFGFAIFEQ